VKKKISIPKLLIAVFILMAYCNVLITQFHCNFSLLLDVSEHIHHNDESDDESHADHHHDDSEKHNDPKDDKCCNDKTSAFFTSQTHAPITSFEFKNTLFTKLISYSNTILFNTLPYNAKEYFSCKYPPPKIRDMQIFTHLFLI
jgi:hypothetical protein